ncbi:MAG: Rab family GTPase [Candidatus Thorarchaeota archaeon]
MINTTRAPVFKTVIIGEGGVGKTSITLRYTEDRFDDNMRLTIGANFASKKIESNGSTLTLMIWDLGGQPRFRDVVSDYFRGSKYAIAVYDVNRSYSLGRLTDWIDRLKESAPDSKILLVGNKTDERENGSGVSYEDGVVFAQNYGAHCVEVSAKTGEGISDMFDLIAQGLIKEHLEGV